jgi:D-alanine transaminase
MAIVYLNGDFVAAESARVGVTDFGFCFAGGVYEIVLVYNGVPYKLSSHLRRLERSANLVGIPFDKQDFEQAAHKIIEYNALVKGSLYMQLTFGDYGVRKHSLPDEIRPTALIMTQAPEHYPNSYYLEGVSLLAAADNRWEHCDIKSIALLPNLITLSRAKKEGYQEVVFWETTTQKVTEGASSNIFCVRDNVLLTPPESSKILSGITRTTIIELACRAGIEVNEADFTISELESAQEVFISGTSKEALPVKRINGSQIAACPGPVTRSIMRLLMEELELETGAQHWKRSIPGLL